jgi:hypothetical protein
VEEHIRQLEERLLQAEARKSAQEVATLLAPAFIEFGSSGRTFTKSQIIEALQREEPARRSLEEFKTSLLAPGVILATYRVVLYGAGGEHPMRSLRSSIWKFMDHRWQMVFHQGTVLGEP